MLLAPENCYNYFVLFELTKFYFLFLRNFNYVLLNLKILCSFFKVLLQARDIMCRALRCSELKLLIKRVRDCSVRVLFTNAHTRWRHNERKFCINALILVSNPLINTL